MRSTDKAKLMAFIDYANDTEGMKFDLHLLPSPHGGDRYQTWTVRPAKGTNYDPQVVAAVKRHFREVWG